MEEKSVINNNEEKTKVKKISKGKILFRLLLIVSIVVILVMVVKRILYKEVVDLKALPTVNITHISKGTIAKDISVTGTVLPNDTYFVPAKVAGEITKIYVENGDHVKKGDPICEIDASKEIEAARITYDAAKKSYERMSKLFHAGDISQQSFETVKTQYDAAKLAYDTKVEYSVPVAVGDGVVENTDMTVNTGVKVDKVLCYITSKEAKEINFGVTERVLDGIKVGDVVVIEKEGKMYDGQISNITNMIDQATGLFNIKALITSENNFASGVNAKVTFTYQRKNNIYILSNDVIYYEAGEPFVYVVGSDNIIEKKYITIGIENKLNTEIVSGLEKKDRIVSSWTSDLAAGNEIVVAKEETPEDIITYEIKEEFVEDIATNSVTYDIINNINDDKSSIIKNIATDSAIYNIINSADDGKSDVIEKNATDSVVYDTINNINNGKNDIIKETTIEDTMVEAE